MTMQFPGGIPYGAPLTRTQAPVRRALVRLGCLAAGSTCRPDGNHHCGASAVLGHFGAVWGHLGGK